MGGCVKRVEAINPRWVFANPYPKLAHVQSPPFTHTPKSLSINAITFPNLTL